MKKMIGSTSMESLSEKDGEKFRDALKVLKTRICVLENKLEDLNEKYEME